MVELRKFEVTDTDARWSAFRDGARAVVAGTYTGLYRNGYLWMSDTPAEQRDHLAPVWEMERRGGRIRARGQRPSAAPALEPRRAGPPPVSGGAERR